MNKNFKYISTPKLVIRGPQGFDRNHQLRGIMSLRDESPVP
jgi:hypothetical protein